jgi:diaminohydroxyphosphoribosylaminopyrimidine deaminase/5-amino-6-(5-phosphoribosylamino)uracil reductase
MSRAADDAYMARALELAERGRGFVEPNPLVGAVVVRDGRIVGEGFHQRYGEAHAEVNALAAAGEKARGATVYVTLEPCCHHGKTPPCTDALLAAGVVRVAAALTDPFPRVAGRGATVLRAAGVSVEFGLGEAAARRQNGPYLKLLRTGRPYVHAKWAMTLDGKIATRTGDSKWISGPESRRRVHELRGRVDAVIVGIGTVLADDPLLTARPPGPRTATRVVLDSRGRLPPDAQLLQTAAEAPLLWVTNADTPTPAAFPGEVLHPPAVDGRPSVVALLDELGRRRMTNVLVEGGAGVLGGFFDAGAVDEVHAFVAPRIAGGADARGPVFGRGVDRIADAWRLGEWESERVGDDWLLHGWSNEGNPIGE